MCQVKRNARMSRGATMVEYALMVALIAIALAAIIFVLQGQLSATFADIAQCITSRGASCG